MTLSKARSVMVLEDEEDEDGFATFSNADHEDGEWEADRAVALSQDLYSELGRPLVLTVTIESGDRLNA